MWIAHGVPDWVNPPIHLEIARAIAQSVPGKGGRGRASGMVEIKNADNLYAWLRDKPRGVSIAIAARAALRVLPALGMTFRFNWAQVDLAQDIVLPSLRGMALPWAAANCPAHGRTLTAAAAADDAATAAADATYATYAAATAATAAGAADSSNTAATAATATAATAARAANAAARAAMAGAADDAAARAAMAGAADDAAARAAMAGAADDAAADDDAATAAMAAVDAASATTAAAAYEEISKDCAAFEDAWRDNDPADLAIVAAVMELPLWHGEPPEELQKLWREMRSALLGLGDHWRVWTGWYELRLEGRIRSDAEELVRAELTDAEWKQDPETVNRLIASREKAVAPVGPGPGAYDFAAHDSGITVEPLNGELTARESVVADLVEDYLRKIGRFWQKQQQTNAAVPEYISDVLDEVQALLSEDDVRPGLLLSRARSMISAARRIADNGGFEAQALDMMFEDLVASLDDLKGCFKDIRDIELEVVKQHVQPDKADRILELMEGLAGLMRQRAEVDNKALDALMMSIGQARREPDDKTKSDLVADQVLVDRNFLAMARDYVVNTGKLTAERRRKKSPMRSPRVLVRSPNGACAALPYRCSPPLPALARYCPASSSSPTAINGFRTTAICPRKRTSPKARTRTRRARTGRTFRERLSGVGNESVSGPGAANDCWRILSLKSGAFPHTCLLTVFLKRRVR